jgi:ubiquinone/menaquinone biosynthesis C-methylase UbiE
MENRKKAERDFHNRLRSDDRFGQRWSPDLESVIRGDPMWVNMKYYAIERNSREAVLNWLRANCPGKRVLDYACGNGEDALFAARNGAQEVVGIDISEVSINNCKKRAGQEGLSQIVHFEVMDAEDLSFPDGSFDIITEYGCLHHLNLAKAYAELARVAGPGGQVICNEALGHNPVIQLYRRLTPHLRTEWEVEHILKRQDLELAHHYFDSIELTFFHLATLLAVLFRNAPFFPSALRALECVDRLLLELPLVKWQAWQIVFVMSQPCKTGGKGEKRKEKKGTKKK